MPGTVDLGTAQEGKDSLSGAKLHKAIGVVAGASAETALEQAAGYGSMGLAGIFRTYGQVTAMVLIAVGMSMAFMWLRSDAKDDRNEYRQQVLRQEQLAEERRREDRQDRAREQDLFRSTLELMSRDSREANLQMSRATDQIKIASDQIKAAGDAIGRVEKAIVSKQPSSIP